MMTGRDGGNAVDGGLARHIPVLAQKALHYLSPRDGGIYIDGTFGAGGYTRAILAAADCSVIGIDRDQSAIARGADLVEQAKGRLTLVEDRFSALDQVAHGAGYEAVDGVVLDIGVSSMQLDEAERGFSFRYDAPLDMRMGNSGPSAADLVACANERDLADDHLRARRGAIRARHRARDRARAQRAADRYHQATCCDHRARGARAARRNPSGDAHVPGAAHLRQRGTCPNSPSALAAAERILKPGGRLVVVSFHSLEDRIVKTFIADRSRIVAGSRHAPETHGPQPTFTALTKKPVTADESEIAGNPRARSAKLRAAERTDAPARDADRRRSAAAISRPCTTR